MIRQLEAKAKIGWPQNVCVSFDGLLTRDSLTPYGVHKINLHN
jgi:hypothetical protein